MSKIAKIEVMLMRFAYKMVEISIQIKKQIPVLLTFHIPAVDLAELYNLTKMLSLCNSVYKSVQHLLLLVDKQKVVSAGYWSC